MTLHRFALQLCALALGSTLLMPAQARDPGKDAAIQRGDFESGQMRGFPPSSSKHKDERKPQSEERRREDPRPVFRSEPDRERARYERERAGSRLRDGDDRREHRRGERREDRRDDRREDRWDNRWDHRWDHRHERRVDYRQDYRYRGPRVGVVVPSLPWGYREVRHHRHSYFFADGYWYQPWGTSFVRIGAPTGVVVSTLPLGYTTLSLGNTVYYRYEDAWYRPHERGYVVVDAPPEAASERPQDEVDDTIFAYPRDGQDERQQAEDRFECHSWAAEQSGYDPSLTSAAGATADSLRKRPDYLRAMTACLEGRGYTVR